MRVPEVDYARSGDVAIAYQIVGDGPRDIVFARGQTGDLLSTWEQPRLVRHVEDLARNGRVLMLDKRGSGLSDRTRHPPSIETAMDDIRAVMDAAGSDRAVVFTGSAGTGMGVLFAATYPERCSALILVDPRAKGTRSVEYPWAPSLEEGHEQIRGVRAHWGERGYLEKVARDWAPEVADDEQFRDWFVWHMRRSLSPGAAVTTFVTAMELDVTDVLPSVRVPTLIIARTAQPGPAYYVAERIAGAEVVEPPGFLGVYSWASDRSHDATMAAVDRFIQGIGAASGPERVLATLLFTDIVGSSEMAVRLGDTAWRELLRRHHAIVRQELIRAHGRELDTAGDGFFAAFDGPARAVRGATAIRDALANIDIPIRAGLHTGECEIHEGKPTGIAVNIAARIAAQAGPGKVLVSSTVKDLVAGSGIRFADYGEHDLPGIPETWRLFAVDPDRR